MNSPIKSNGRGTIGTVYKTKSGHEEHEFESDDGEGRTGWKQVTPSVRHKVKRVRVGHTVCDWREIDQNPSANHKEYALF